MMDVKASTPESNIECTVDGNTSEDPSGVPELCEREKTNAENEQFQNVSIVSEEQNLQEEITASKHNDRSPLNVENDSELSNGVEEIDSPMNGMRADMLQNPSPGNEEDQDSMSEISDFSDFSQESWHPVQGPIAWVQEQMRQGQSARAILEDLVPPGTMIPDDVDPIMMWRLIINIVSEPPKRKKLESINTLEDVVSLLRNCNKIIVLTGAGVSVSCGIPDFRSRGGVYARLAVDFPNLPDPQAMFDIHFFRNDPRPFFKFAKEIYPGQFKPSLCHHFIRLIESQGKLLRNYTQNIDTLEQEAGIERVVQCHGSFATATCTNCKCKVKADVVRDDIFKQVIPKCSQCPEGTENAIMKPDIVFFGESLPEDFHKQMAADKDECDLLIVIGSSLKVRPVALIPNSVPPHVPQILINRERLHYLNFDVELLGNCDDIVGELCHRLGSGWDQLAFQTSPLSEVVMSSLPTPPTSPHSENQPSSSYSSVDKNEIGNDTVEGPVTSAETKTTPVVEDVESNEEMSVEESEALSCTNCSGDKTESMTRAGVGLNDNTTVEIENVSQAVGESVSSSDAPTSHSSSLSLPLGESKKEDISSKNALNEEVTTTSSTACLTLDEGCVDRLGSHGEPAGEKNVASDGVSSTSSEHSIKRDHHHHHQHHHHHHHNHSHSHHHNHHHHHHHHHHNKHHHHTHHHTHHSSSKPSSSSSSAEKQTIENSSDTKEPVEKRARLESVTEPSPKASSGDVESTTTSTSTAPGEDPMERYRMEEDELEEMRKMWQGRRNRISLAQRLAENQYLFLPPNRYVFKGAEVYSDDDDDDDDEDNDNKNDNGDANDDDVENGNSSVEVEETPVNNSTSNKPSLPTADLVVSMTDKAKEEVSSTREDKNGSTSSTTDNPQVEPHHNKMEYKI